MIASRRWNPFRGIGFRSGGRAVFQNYICLIWIVDIISNGTERFNIGMRSAEVKEWYPWIFTVEKKGKAADTFCFGRKEERRFEIKVSLFFQMGDNRWQQTYIRVYILNAENQHFLLYI